MAILSNSEILAWTLTILVASSGCIAYYEACRRRDMRRNGRLQEQLLHAMSPVGPLRNCESLEGSVKTRRRRPVVEATEVTCTAALSSVGGETR